MSIQARELFRLAREVEEKIARLYEDLLEHLAPGSAEARFFAQMAAQEHMHASWVDEMAAEAVADVPIEGIGADDFAHILNTIDDVHDEVMNEEIDLCGALEIVLHLEKSTAEEFYLRFPEKLPGVPETMVSRMARSCMEHAAMVGEFRERYTCDLRARQAREKARREGIG
jgi:rubrerythrin